MHPDLAALCRQYVTVEHRTGVDAQGNPTYGAASSHRCRVSGVARLVLNARGEAVYSTASVHFVANPAVAQHDRLTLSTGDVNSTETGLRQRPILAVGRYPDEQNRAHYAVFLA